LDPSGKPATLEDLSERDAMAVQVQQDASRSSSAVTGGRGSSCETKTAQGENKFKK